MKLGKADLSFFVEQKKQQTSYSLLFVLVSVPGLEPGAT